MQRKTFDFSAGGGARRAGRLLLVALIVLAAWLLVGRLTRRRTTAAPVPLAAVQQGPLTISLNESGTIQSRDKVIVRSQVEGRNTLVWLIEEGRHVQAGDLLAEIDSSSFQDRLFDAEIRVQNAEAAMIHSREGLEVTRNQAAADVEQAELNLRFAQLALDKYANGEYPRELQQAEAEITMAAEELQRAEDTLTWSRRLANDNFLTRSELQADELAHKRRQLDLQLAEGKLELLKEFTNVQQMEKLRSDIRQAELALERVRRRATADLIRAEADRAAKQSEFERQQLQLERIEEQIALCRITAPASGMVVYATSVQTRRWGRTEPLQVGQDVSERQELIHMPTTSEMLVELRVQEASLNKIRLGMPARITVDSLPGEVFAGRLERIAVLPDSAQAWLNPDLKQYNCEVYLDSDVSRLRPGMSCRVELIVETHDQALFVPLQALVRVQGVPTVYVWHLGEAAPRPVVIGLDNGRMVHVIEGVAADEQVLLAPPLPPSAVQAPAPVEVPPPTALKEEIETAPRATGETDAQAKAPHAGAAEDTPPADGPAPRRRRPPGAERRRPAAAPEANP
ncbi:MAG: HlyD family efflux transporter periplasmic adaptor subunit [Candidatus Marinimicrobia bacterium]|nr:HlyD family efflux transporter periplasmic adaptor subunit [Candidatus Neomarinimicrobiota bacterium]